MSATRFALIILFAYVHQAAAKVEVHMDYLWEETDATLQQVIKQNPGKTVLLINTDQFGANDLYSRAISYSGEAPRTVVSSGGVSGETPEARVARAIENRAATGVMGSDPSAVILTGSNLNTGGDTNFKVTNLTPSAAKNSDDIIIVMHSPESGRQPTLLANYMNVALPAFKSLPEADSKNGGMHVSSFGTAGGVASGNGPGHVDNVKASIFAGVERIPGTDQFRSKISYASLDGKQVDLYNGKAPFTSREAAEKDVQNAFINLNPASVKPLVANGDTSLTTTFFGSPDMKKVADSYGLKNVNMEDYQMIRTAQSMKADGKPLDSMQVGRVVADPPTLNPETMKSVNGWMNDGRYSQKQYEDAVLWGAKGRDLNKTPDSAQWTADQNDATGIALTRPIAPGKGALDPFFYAIAGKLQDSAAGGHFVNSLVDKKALAGLPQDPEFKQALDAALNARGAELSKLAATIKAGKGKSEAELKPTIHQFIEGLSTVQVNYQGKTVTVPLLQDPATGKMRILSMVPELRGGGAGATVDEAYSTGVSKENLDRMLYKFSLLTLQPTAQQVEAEFHKTSLERAKQLIQSNGGVLPAMDNVQVNK